LTKLIAIVGAVVSVGELVGVVVLVAVGVAVCVLVGVVVLVAVGVGSVIEGKKKI
jgi:hypothetical protein